MDWEELLRRGGQALPPAGPPAVPPWQDRDYGGTSPAGRSRTDDHRGPASGPAASGYRRPGSATGSGSATGYRGPGNATGGYRGAGSGGSGAGGRGAPAASGGTVPWWDRMDPTTGRPLVNGRPATNSEIVRAVGQALLRAFRSKG